MNQVKHWFDAPLTWMTLSLISILGIEILSYNFSIYPPNSIHSLEKICYWVCFCLILKWVWVKSMEYKAMHLVFHLIHALSLLLSIGALLSFSLFRSKLNSLGWNEIYPFKGYFSPFGFKLNDWATIAICMLPFPLISTLLLRKNKVALYSGLLSSALCMYSVFISFSRGAYIALVIFIAILCFITIYLKILTLKKVIIPLSLLVAFLAILSYPIRDSLFTVVSMNKTISQNRSTLGRIEIIKDGISKMKEHFWLGRGGYNFAFSDKSKIQSREDSGASHFANNLYLQIGVEKGVLGLLLYGALFLLILIGFYKRCLHCKILEEQFVSCLLFSGFFAYCVKEIFFASFFENNLVTIYSEIYFSISSAMQSSKVGLKSPYIKIGTVLIFSIALCWVINKKMQHAYSNQEIQQALEIKGNKSESLKHIENAIKRSPDVATYYMLAGLTNAKDSIFIKDVLTNKYVRDTENLNKSIEYFNQASLLDPHNANDHFNLGCLYHSKEASQKDSSIIHFEKAIELDPQNSEYLIGYGMHLESRDDTISAYKLYERAIRIDPEIIDSKFYREWVERYPLAIKLMQHGIDTLSIISSHSSSPILSARLAKLKLAIGDTASARSLLLKVIHQMPDLSRPYLTLGCITEHTSDSLHAIELYKKSMYLNSKDYLPLLASAKYYSSKSNNLDAKSYTEYYFSKGIDLYKNLPSQSSSKSSGLYRDQYYPPNDLIWSDLPMYIRSTVYLK